MEPVATSRYGSVSAALIASSVSNLIALTALGVALLTDLFEGQEATVLQLPAQLGTAAEIKAQERVPHI